MRTGVNRRQIMAGLAAGAVSACSLPARSEVLVSLAGAARSEVNGVWIWVQAFAEVLRNGGVSVEVSPNSALGNELDRTELTGLGLLHVNDSGSTELSEFSDAYRASGLPFVFDSMAHFDRFLQAPAFLDRLGEELAPAGLVFADAALLGGMSGLFTARTPVASVADVENLRLRAMGRLDLMMIEAIGASGVQVAWEEVPQALQTGIAEGYFNPPLAPVMFGHGSQIGHFSELRLGAAHRAIVLSQAWLDSLDSERRRLVDNAVRAGHAANRAWAVAGQERERAALLGIGVEIYTPTQEDRQVFVDRVRAAYPDMASPEAVAFVSAIAEQTRS